jgi:hypothetical protein
MSFILDALKKSDQERQRRSAPSIHTDHSAAAEQRWERRRLWPYLIITALVLNAGLLLWWLHPWESGKPDLAATGTSTQGPASSTSPTDRAAARDRPQEAAQQSRQAKRRGSRPEHSVIESSPVPKNAPPQPRGDLADARPGQSMSEQTMPERARAIPVRPPPKPDMKKAPDPKPSQTAVAAQPPPAKTASPDAAGKSKAKLDKGHSPSASVPASTAAPSAAEPPMDRLGRPDSAAVPDMERKAAPQTKPATESKPEQRIEPKPTPTPVPEAKPKPEAKPEPVGSVALSDKASVALPDRQTSVTQSKAIGEEFKSVLDGDSGSKEGVLQFHELPFPVREAMPNLSLSMLIYSQNPADRMVGVNGHVRREGQQVDTGLKLERITPNGAVFSFQGYLFYKGVF